MLDPTNKELLADKSIVSDIFTSTTRRFQPIFIKTNDLIKSFDTLDETTIYLSNAYYVRFEADYLVDNLAWSNDRRLNTCDDTLRDKVREGLVGLSEMESGELIVWKKTIEFIKVFDNAALKSLIESLHNLCMKDVAGDSVGIVVNYLSGVLLLLKNCLAIPTNVNGLFNDVIVLIDCDEFVEYMRLI